MPNFFDSIPVDGGTAVAEPPAPKNFFDTIPVEDSPAVKPEGVLKTIGREFSSRIAPAAATGVGGVLGGLAAGAIATPETVGIGTIPAAIAGDVAAGTAAGYAAEKAQNALMGEEWVKQNEAQRRANAEANPMSAQLGGLVPFLLSMVGGGYGREAFKGGAKVLTKAGEAAAKAGTAVPKIESMAQAAAGGARAGGGEGGAQAADTGDFSHIPDDIAKSALAFGATGMFAPAKSILQAATGRAVKDAAAMTLANEIYDVARGKKDFDLKATANELGGSIPAFALQNAILGALHGRVIPGHALPLTAPKEEAAPASGATAPPDTSSDIDKVDLTVPPPEDTTAIASALGQPAPRQPILSNVPDKRMPILSNVPDAVVPEPPAPDKIPSIQEAQGVLHDLQSPEIGQAVDPDMIEMALDNFDAAEAKGRSIDWSRESNLMPNVPTSTVPSLKKLAGSKEGRDVLREAININRQKAEEPPPEVPEHVAPIIEVSHAAERADAPEVAAVLQKIAADDIAETISPQRGEGAVIAPEAAAPSLSASLSAGLSGGKETEPPSNIAPTDGQSGSGQPFSPEIPPAPEPQTPQTNATPQGKIEQSDQSERANRDETRQAPEASRGNRAVESGKVPQVVSEPASSSAAPTPPAQEVPSPVAPDAGGAPENIKKDLNVSEGGGKGAGMETTTPEIPESGKYSIYQAGDRWLIQQSDKRGFGDQIVDSKEEAIAASTQQQKMEKANKEYFDRVKAKEDAAKAAQEAKDKPLNDYLDSTSASPMQRGKIKSALDQGAARRSSATGKTYQGNRFQVVSDLVADGYKPVVEEVDAIQPLTGQRMNRMDNREQAAYEKKRAAAGKKTQYSLEHPSGGSFVVTKAEHDLASYLESQKTKTPAAPSPAKVESDEGKLPSVATNPPGSSHPAVVDTAKKPESEGIASGNRDTSKPEQMTPEEATSSQRDTELPKNYVLSDGNGNFVTEEKNGWFKVWRWGITHATLAGTYGFKGREGLDKAKSRLKQISEEYHQEKIGNALRTKRPVSASAVEAYNIKLPEGYKKQGELYVYEKPAEGERPIPPGHFRLYRGEGVGYHRADLPDETRGTWFTTNKERAVEHAGEDGRVVSIDLPKREAGKYLTGGMHDENLTFNLPHDIASKAEPLTKPTPSDKRVDTILAKAAEIGDLQKKVKERAQIFNAGAKEDAANLIGLPPETFYNLPYSKWGEIDRAIQAFRKEAEKAWTGSDKTLFSEIWNKYAKANPDKVSKLRASVETTLSKPPPPEEPGGSAPAPKEPIPKKPSPTHLTPGDPVSFKQEGRLLSGEFAGKNKDGTYAVKVGDKTEHVTARNLNDNNGGKVVEGTKYAVPSDSTNSMPHSEAQDHLDSIGVPRKKVRVVDKPDEFWQGRWNSDGSIDLNTAHIGSKRELMDILFNHENTHDALMSGPEGPKLAKALEGFTDALSEKELGEIHDALAGYREHGVSAEDMRQEHLVQMVRKLTENRPDLQTKWGRFVDSVTLAIKKFLGIKNLSRARAELLAAQILARGTRRVMRGEMNGEGGKGELYALKPSPSASPEHEEAVARAEASYRKETAKDKIIAAAKEVATGLRQIRSLLAPASVSPEAQLSAGFTRQRAAELEHRRQQGIEALKLAKKMFDGWGEAESVAFIDRLEKDQKQATPELEALAKTLRAALDSRVEAVRKLGTGKLENVIEDYFPHIWEKPDEAKSAYQRIFGKRPLEGSKAFLKQRTIPTTLEGMSWRVYDSKGDLVDTYKDEATAQAAAAGMTDAHVSAPMRPVTYNPVELTLMKIHEMDRYIMGQRLLADLKGQKLLTAVPYGQRPPQGYTAINDSIARTNIRNPGTGKMEPAVWHAPADASRVLNNYLSPGLRGVKVFDAWRGIGNAMNMAQLGMSAFHAGMVSADSMISSGALGLEQLARGRFSEAAKSFAKIPIAPIYTMMKGHELMKQYKADQSVLTPEQRKMIDSFTAAGGRASMDSFYRTGAVGAFTKALKAGNYPGAVFRLPFAALEAVSHPLMEFAVPRMKLGIFYDMAREELARMPATATQPEVQKRMGKIWDSIDNRMGQLVYDNLFWHKALKDTMMASVRSVGWNLGTIRELGGGFKDMLTVKSRLKDGGDFLTHRMAYTIMMPVVAGIIGGIYQYLKTGETPQDLKDWYMPRTGATKPDGSAERVELPTYMKDVVSYRHHPGQTILNKLHPLANSITEMYANKDFYGNEIRDSDAEPVKQLQQEVEFIARQFVPFTVRNAGQRQPGSGIGAESFFGINPAPAELTRSDAQNKMVDFIVNHSPQGGRTPEEAARTQARKDLLGRMRQGEDVRKELKESPLSVRQQKQVIRDSRTDPVLTMFKHLSASEAADVLELADEKEKDVLTKPFIAKYAKLPLKDKKEIQAKAKGGTLEALQRIGAIR